MTYSKTDQHASGINSNKLETERPRILQGMKEICAYMGRSENTIIKYIREEGLPAGKIGGEGVSEKRKIDDWLVMRIR